MPKFVIRGNRLSKEDFQFKMAPPLGVQCWVPAVCFPVLLQLIDIVFYLNLIVYKYKRQRVRSLLRDA